MQTVFAVLFAACLQALLARLEVKLRLQQQNVANIAPLLQRLFPKTARSGDIGSQMDGQDACIACWAAWRCSGLLQHPSSKTACSD